MGSSDSARRGRCSSRCALLATCASESVLATNVFSRDSAKHMPEEMYMLLSEKCICVCAMAAKPQTEFVHAAFVGVVEIVDNAPLGFVWHIVHKDFCESPGPPFECHNKSPVELTDKHPLGCR